MPETCQHPKSSCAQFRALHLGSRSQPQLSRHTTLALQARNTIPHHSLNWINLAISDFLRIFPRLVRIFCTHLFYVKGCDFITQVFSSPYPQCLPMPNKPSLKRYPHLAPSALKSDRLCLIQYRAPLIIKIGLSGVQPLPDPQSNRLQLQTKQDKRNGYRSRFHPSRQNTKKHAILKPLI